MKVTYELTQDEKLKMMHSAFCNGMDYYFPGYGLQWDWSSDDYKAAKVSLEAKKATGEWKPDYEGGEICHEDVLVEMLRMGKNLNVHDIEDDSEIDADAEDFEDNVSLYPIVGVVNLANIEANWDKIPARHLKDMVEEQDDAETADNFLQAIAFGEIKYG